MILDATPFFVSCTASVTCSSDDGVADRIEIVSEDGQLMASEVSVQTLTLTVNPVTDSLHNTTFTCSVTRNMGGTANQTVSCQAVFITVNGMQTVVYHLLLSPISHARMHTHTHLVPSGAISATVNRTGRPVAGSEFSLSCIVEAVPGFTEMPTAEWRDAGDRTVVTGGDITVQTSSPGNRVTVTTLTFNPVKATDVGRYMCIGSLTTPVQPGPLQDSTMEDLRVQSKQLHHITTPPL